MFDLINAKNNYKDTWFLRWRPRRKVELIIELVHAINKASQWLEHGEISTDSKVTLKSMIKEAENCLENNYL